MRGAIRTLEEVGFLDRAVTTGSTHRPTPNGLHRKPVLFMFGSEYDLAIAVAAVLTCQRDEIGGEPLFVLSAPRRFALGRAMLAERPAGAALGDVQPGPDVLDTGAPTRGAQKFPRAASCRISLSRVRSATALRRRWFSVSSSFMRLT